MAIYSTFTSGSKTFVPGSDGTYRNSATTLSSPSDILTVRPGKTAKNGTRLGAVSRTQVIANPDGTRAGVVEIELIIRSTGIIPDAAAKLKGMQLEVNDFLTEGAITRVLLGDS